MNSRDMEEIERTIEFARLKIAKAKASAKGEKVADCIDDIELGLGWVAKKLARLKTTQQNPDSPADGK